MCRDDCSGMPPANNQARTDIISELSSKLAAASLLLPQSPQEDQGLDSHDAQRLASHMSISVDLKTTHRADCMAADEDILARL